MLPSRWWWCGGRRSSWLIVWMYRYCQSNCPFLSPLVSRLDVWPQAQPHSCPMFRPIARFCQCSNVVPMFQCFDQCPDFAADNSGDSWNKTFANCVIKDVATEPLKPPKNKNRSLHQQHWYSSDRQKRIGISLSVANPKPKIHLSIVFFSKYFCWFFCVVFVLGNVGNLPM